MRAFKSIIAFLLCLAASFSDSTPSEGVGAQGVSSPPRYAGFADIPPDKNRFCVVGDTQKTSHWEFWRERNDPERRRILAGILARDPAFVINLGDLTTRGGSAEHWRDFDANHEPFRDRKIPLFPVLGNHEFYGSNRKALGHFFARFPYLEGRFWYSFSWRNVGFVMLDSKFEALASDERRAQREWLVAELERFEKDPAVDFVIACCHEAPFTNSRVIKANPNSRADFADAFVRSAKSALFLSGHSHSYEKFEVGGKIFIVSGGGGGPRHKVQLDPAKRRFRDLFPGPELRFFHFGEVETDGERLVLIVRKLEDGGTFSGGRYGHDPKSPDGGPLSGHRSAPATRIKEGGST